MRWGTHATAFRAYGVTIEISASDPELLAAATDRALPPSWEPAAGRDQDVGFQLRRIRRDLCDVDRGDHPVARAADISIAVSILDSLVRSELALRAVDRVFVHAGVVRLGDRAMVLPGASFSGKSTLVAALVSAGMTYMSDEFALLDAAGAVHPYPRPVSLRLDGQLHGSTRETDPATLGRVERDRPAEVAVIVATRYRPGVLWQPSERSTGEGALVLLGHAAAARDRPQEALAVVRNAARDAAVFAGDRGDVGETANALVELLRNHSSR